MGSGSSSKSLPVVIVHPVPRASVLLPHTRCWPDHSGWRCPHPLVLITRKKLPPPATSRDVSALGGTGLGRGRLWWDE
jgi:hypothetical protein